MILCCMILYYITGEKALADAGVKYTDIQQACCSYVYGDTTCGQRVVYGLGMTGIPVYNVSWQLSEP